MEAALQFIGGLVMLLLLIFIVVILSVLIFIVFALIFLGVRNFIQDLRNPKPELTEQEKQKIWEDGENQYLDHFHYGPNKVEGN